MILDLNQVMLSNLMMQLGNHSGALDEGMVRHMILNTVRSLNSKYRNTYGQLVIAADGPHNWRRTYFPNYKIRRRLNQSKSTLDWSSIYSCMNTVREELKEYFPYPVVHVEGCEADDVIATLTNTFTKNGEKVLILSGDKDFRQLHNGLVTQFDPTRKKFLTVDDPKEVLKEHIITGDSGDDIPNVLSPDNTFADGIRQVTLTAGRMETLRMISLDMDIGDDIRRNFIRNSTLIDLSNTPQELKDKILAEYSAQLNKPQHDLIKFFMARNLKNLMEYINDF